MIKILKSTKRVNDSVEPVWPDLLLGELLFSLSRCFRVQSFIAKVINEKHRTLFSGEEAHIGYLDLKVG